LMPKGECAHNLFMWGWCVSPCLSIYPRIVDMYELMCVVWWLVKNLEPF
jgi:hypothetical protein